MIRTEIKEILVPKRCHRCGDEIPTPRGVILKILRRPDPIMLCTQCHNKFLHWFSTGEKQPNTRPSHSAHRTYERDAKTGTGVPQFIELHIRPEPTGIITKKKLYTKYHAWCLTTQHTPLTVAAFSRAFIKYATLIIPNLISTRRNIDGIRYHCWAGIIDKTDY